MVFIRNKKRDLHRVIPLMLTVMGLLMFLPSCTEFIATKIPRPFDSSALDLERPQWSNGETIEYRVVDDLGNYLGYVQFAFARDGGNWVLTRSGETARLEEHFTLRLDGGTLKPISQVKTFSTAEGNLELKARYHSDKVEIEARIGEPGQKADRQAITKMSATVPPNAVDNDQLPMLLRCLPFSEGYSAEYINVVPELALNTPVTVKVLGREIVDTPAGLFDAWRVEVDFGQVVHSLWYEVDSPHHLVKYDNGDAQYLLVNPKRQRQHFHPAGQPMTDLTKQRDDVTMSLGPGGLMIQ